MRRANAYSQSVYSGMPYFKPRFLGYLNEVIYSKDKNVYILKDVCLVELTLSRRLCTVMGQGPWHGNSGFALMNGLIETPTLLNGEVLPSFGYLSDTLPVGYLRESYRKEAASIMYVSLSLDSCLRLSNSLRSFSTLIPTFGPSNPHK